MPQTLTLWYSFERVQQARYVFSAERLLCCHACFHPIKIFLDFHFLLMRLVSRFRKSRCLFYWRAKSLQSMWTPVTGLSNTTLKFSARGHGDIERIPVRKHHMRDKIHSLHFITPTIVVSRQFLWHHRYLRPSPTRDISHYLPRLPRTCFN